MGVYANNFYFVFSCLCVSFDLLWNRINFTSMRAFHFLFFFFLKENPTNNNKVTDLKLDRSIHKLFSDRMSKNVSVYIHIEFDDFNSYDSISPFQLTLGVFALFSGWWWLIIGPRAINIVSLCTILSTFPK